MLNPAGIVKEIRNSRFNFIRRNLIPINLIVLIAFINLITGCHYYKVENSTPTPLSIKREYSAKKYFILHTESNAWHLTDLIISAGNDSLSGRLNTLPPEHEAYKKTINHSKNHYNPSTLHPEYEVHIYTGVRTGTDNSIINIPFTSIKSIKVYDNHSGIGSGVFIGLAAATLLAILIIVLSKPEKPAPTPTNSSNSNGSNSSSCPYIYVDDGSDFVLQGELYGGAIYSSLERDDYLVLNKIKAKDEYCHLKIVNELEEVQNTNLAELEVINHPANTEVLIDKYGCIQTIQQPVLPELAFTDVNQDCRAKIKAKDDITYFFNKEGKLNHDFASLNLVFNKPANATSGKLIVRAANTIWLDELFEKFTSHLGTSYTSYVEKQKKIPAAKNIKWSLEQGIPLSIYIRQGEEWKFVDYFELTGPIAARDLVLNIDLSAIQGEKVELKLESGFMFWELDYAAMDFTENCKVTSLTCPPLEATDEHGNDVTSSLLTSDTDYLSQPEIGNSVNVKYRVVPGLKSGAQTIILHSRGYYTHKRNYKGLPDYLFLSSFFKKGAFSRYSHQEFDNSPLLKNLVSILPLGN